MFHGQIVHTCVDVNEYMNKQIWWNVSCEDLCLWGLITIHVFRSMRKICKQYSDFSILNKPAVRLLSMFISGLGLSSFSNNQAFTGQFGKVDPLINAPVAAQLLQDTSPSQNNYVCECELCGKIYINAQLLHQHLEKCRKKKYVCNICGIRCARPAELKKHVKIHEKR